jgi:hypothetical protein
MPLTKNDFITIFNNSSYSIFYSDVISYRIRFVVHETFLDVVVFIAKVYNRYDLSRNCADGSNSINRCSQDVLEI